jgi:hypothetical protein
VDGGSGANLYVHDRTLAAAGTDSADHTNGGTDWDMAGIVINPGSGSGATWAANEDTKLTGLATETTRRLRFLVDNSGTATSGAVSYELQVAETATCSGGSYTAVDSSTHWNIMDSTNVTDGSASENVSGGLTDPGTSSWVAGELEDSADSTDTVTLAADEFTEIEFAVQATTSATAGGDYCFKLVEAGSGDLDTYTQYAKVSIAGGGNSPPTLTVNDPDGTSDTVTVGQNYSINYDLADTDDTVTVAFYYDDDDTGLNGTAISGACATAAEGTGVTCTWDTTGMTTGSYYVYGVTNDGTNMSTASPMTVPIRMSPITRRGR